MLRVYAAVAIVWLLLMPPLFTNGECTAELDGLSSALQAQPRLVSTPDAARTLLAARSAAISVVSADDCRRVKPRFLAACGSGPLVYAEVPVQNRVCRLYRDSAIKVQLQYDERQRLSRLVFDMAPYRSLQLPWGGAIHWGR